MSTYYERHGADGTMLYCCPVCLRVELNSYEGWLWHIGSREHQTSNVKTLSPFFNPKGKNKFSILNRCVDVHEVLGLKAHQLLEYYKTWGEIEDFSYWYKKGGEDGMAVRCVVLYKEKDAAEACIAEKEHKLNGKTMRVGNFKGSNVQGELRQRDRNRKRRNEGDMNDGQETKRGKY